MESARYLDQKGRLRMGLWMVERFTLAGVTFQNWMIVALAIVLVGGLLAWWRQRWRAASAAPARYSGLRSPLYRSARRRIRGLSGATF